jgi:hypothetical protein
MSGLGLIKTRLCYTLSEELRRTIRLQQRHRTLRSACNGLLAGKIGRQTIRAYLLVPALVAAAPAVAAIPVPAPAPAANCDRLRTLIVPSVEIRSVTIVDKDGAMPFSLAAAPVAANVALCVVAAIARPTADSDIRFELWIPAGTAWNGKFLQVGNGGLAGKIPYGTMLIGLAKGYAVAGTDDGHQTEDNPDAPWALGHPAKIVDFGWRAVKATTDGAKAILVAYGRKPEKSYFFGCSDGGR